MARPVLVRSLAAAALPALVLFGCGGSHDKQAASASPAAPAAGSPQQAGAPGAAPAPGGGAPGTPPAAPGSAPAGAQLVAPPVDPKKPVATVNGVPITLEQVYAVYEMNRGMLQQRGQALNENDDHLLKAQSLKVVVADELLYQAAVAKGIKISPAEVEAALKQAKQRAGGSEEAYKKFLAGAGLTDAQVRDEIQRNLQTEAYRKGLTAGKAITEAQAKAFYDGNVAKGMFNVPEQVHVQYILVKATEKDPESVRIDAKKRADEAAKRAAAGEDFAALAKQYSQDTTAARGGDIGFIPRGVMFPKFEETAFTLKPGEVSPVFETPKGFNIMKVLEKHAVTTQTFDQVKAELMLEMGRAMEQQVVRDKVDELASAAKIVVLDRSFALPPPAPAVASAQKPAAPSPKP
jgi:peptidyl-prolyl cis-trans isomerase C